MAKVRPEKFMMRVIRGGLQPADEYTRARLREKGYSVGDIVAARITKPRNPGFHRLAHQLGAMIAHNVESFTGLDAHAVLKRLQIEGNIACDEMAIIFPGIGPTTYRQAKSLSFESMDEGEFHDVYRAMCRHVAATYWPSLDEDQVAEMAELFPGAEAS